MCSERRDLNSPAVYLPVVFLLLTACAVPQPPTGGPEDRTPPIIENSDPPTGATNVEVREIRIQFSEYVNRSSLERALSVSPSFQDPLRFDWSGRSVTLRFPDSLRAQTTYRFLIDTDFQDIHGVALQQPITIAFSTGPTIDSLRLAGTVRDASRGTPIPDISVLAIPAAPSDTISRGDFAPYRTISGSEGTFELTYLPDTTLYVYALEDQNRNRQPEPSERFAPPPQARLTPQATPNPPGSQSWVLTRLDTIRPRINRVDSVSSERSRLRFSEPVQILDQHPSWILQPEGSSDSISIQHIYSPTTPQNTIVLQTQPLRSMPMDLRIEGGIADTSGNTLADTTLTFTPATHNDTTRVRFLGWTPPGIDGPLPLNIYPGFTTNRPIPAAELSSAVTAQDSATGKPLPGTFQTSNGTRYRFHPANGLQPGHTIRLTIMPRLTNADSTRVQYFRYYPTTDLGSLIGTVESTHPSPARLRLVQVESQMSVSYTTSTDSSGKFQVQHLPAGTYRLRAYLDRNGDHKWNGGRLFPYQPQEPVLWRDEINIRARWESTVDTLHFQPPVRNE